MQSQSPQISLNTTQQLKRNLTEFLRLTVLDNQWIPITHRQPQPDGKGLTPKQARFLLLKCREALYGGAAGGGKSEALLMGALQFVNVPRYSAILFRRSFTDLSKAGALIDRAHEWLDPTEAHWDGINHIWKFPSTAKLSFGALENDRDVFHHQSAEYQYIGFDELTQFTEYQYRYLIGRARRLEGVRIPIRIRGASNPGNIGHDWVKRRFLIEGETYGRVFTPAKLDENPNLDIASYIESLNQLDPITRQQYRDGDWSARHGGSAFKREKFEVITQAPADLEDIVRYWDTAATKPKDGSDPDWTVGVKMGVKQGLFHVLDVVRFRGPPQQVENAIKQTAMLDGVKVRVFKEQEPGSAGVESADHYSKVLVGFIFTAIKTTGSKAERAGPFASQVMAGSESNFGNVKLVNGTWVNAFLDELEAFPLGSHDDQVDAASGAFEQLRKHGDLDVSFGKARL